MSHHSHHNQQQQQQLAEEASPRQLLGDITESAHSQANVTRHNAYAKPTPVDVNYYQQQYHSAVLQDAINVHAQYMQLQEQGLAAQAFLLQQQLMAQAAATATHMQQPRNPRKSTSPNSNSRSPRGNNNSNSRRASPVVTHDTHHGDDEASPCDCPDCNMRRLQEVMSEAPVYAPTTRRFAPLPQMDFDPVALYAAHLNSPMMRGASLPTSPLMTDQHGGYGMPMYETQIPAVTKHNPYAPHSPTSVPAVGYEVPYIPARGDYAHYATDVPNESRDGSAAESLEDGEREIPTGKAPSPKKDETSTPARRTGPPKPSPKQPSRRASPSLVEQLSTSTDANTALPSSQAATVAPVAATPTRQQSNTNSRRTSPKSATPTVPSSLHEPCTFLLRLKVSQWHTNVAIAARENIAVGTHIKFEGDRGEDLGCVTSCTEATPEETTSLPRMRSRATNAEVEKYLAYAIEAATTVPAAQAAVDRAGLHMRLVGAVFQFNREKLTFMYDSNERVDFRQLVRDLYGLFRCRIWMEPISGCAAAVTNERSSNRKGGRTSPLQA